LARLLIHPAKVWLLDEPTVGLDDVSCEMLQQLLTDHLANNGLLMVATHVDLGLSDGTFDVLRLGASS